MWSAFLKDGGEPAIGVIVLKAGKGGGLVVEVVHAAQSRAQRIALAHELQELGRRLKRGEKPP